MSKLQRAVDGQTIQFLSLPKIFNSLSADLPSGAVKLPNGEIAYWRLHRNLTELKKNRKNIKDLTTKLAQAFKALVNSDAFLNHYGLAKSPDIESEAKLTTTFRALLGLNTNRVEYTTINHGRSKPLVEQIIVPLGNLVFFNAYRGVAAQPNIPGIKGKMWLSEGADADQCFTFTIVSPSVTLADYISADRLKSEVLNKMRLNLPIMVHNPIIEFNEGQFENYVGRGLEQLANKHGHDLGTKKNKSALTSKPGRGETTSITAQDNVREKTLDELIADNVKTKEAFEAMDEEGQKSYLQTFFDLVDRVQTGESTELAACIPAFLKSGVLEAQWKSAQAESTAKMSQPYFLAQVLSLTDAQFEELLGAEEPKFLEEHLPMSLTFSEKGPADRMETTLEVAEAVIDAAADSVPTPGDTYVIKEGDSLFSISEVAYGDGDLWTNIHLANKDQIADPSELPVGIVIQIPNLAHEEIEVPSAQEADIDPPAEVSMDPAGTFSGEVKAA